MLRDAVQDMRRRGVVIVKRPRLWPGGQDAGIVGPADDNPDAPALRERQKTVERLLFQQCVAPGQEENVEISALGQPLAGLPFVHAGAERVDHALVAQRHKRFVAARHQLCQLRVKHLLAAVVEDIEIMGKEHVHTIHTQPLQAEFERPHHAIVAIVVDLVARGHVEPLAMAVARVLGGGAQQAADLR